MASVAADVRAIYRKLLRELPMRHPSILASPSPVQKHIRKDIESTSHISNASIGPEERQRMSLEKFAQAEQFVQYLKNQRMYATLIERYNPGMNMEEEERIRLTARRVGMDLPVELGQNGGQEK